MFLITVGGQQLYTQYAGEYRGPLYLEGSLDIGIVVFGRSTAEFAIWDEDAIWHYYQGQVVEIRDADYNLLFGGVIEIVEEERIKGPVNHRVHHISCVDWNWIADKRLLFMAVENQHAGDIVTTIFNTILVDEGVTIGEIQQGALIPEFRAGYSTLTEALDALAEYSEFIWFITESRELYFIAPTTYNAPRALTDDDIIEDSYNYSIGNDQYRNRQYSIGGQGRTLQLTEDFAGDGKTRTFKLSRSVAIEPTVIVNSSVKTVGIGQVDADGSHDFYWNEDSDTITQDSSGTILETSDTLRVVFYGLYKVINSASDFTQIAARAALDGTSGIIEEVMSGSLMTSANAAIVAAEAKLSRYSRDAKKFDFQTISNEFAVGTMLSVEFTAFDFPVDYLITNIHITEDEDGGGPLYAITCCDGPASTEWEDVYKDINHEARSKKIELGALNDADMLVLAGFANTWQEVDYPNPFASVTPFDIATLGGYNSPSGTLWGESSDCLYLIQFAALFSGIADKIRVYGRTAGYTGNAKAAIYADSTTQLLGSSMDISTGYRRGNFLYMHKFAATASGLMTSINVYMQIESDIKVAIYADDAGEPGALLAQYSGNWAVEGHIAHADRWVTVPLSTFVDVVEGTNYWLAYITDVDAVGINPVTTPVRYLDGQTFRTYNFPNPAGSGYSSMAVGSCIQGFCIKPGDLLTANDISASTLGGQWNDVPVPPIEVVAGVNYWLGVISERTLACYPEPGLYANKYLKATTYDGFTFPGTLDISTGEISEPGTPTLITMGCGALPGDHDLPCFDPDDRWKYIVIYRAGAEIFRKAALAVEHFSDKDYASCYIAAIEAIGAISHIGLWGGQGCSATPGSGIELDKQVYVREKTNLESLEVVFTENRW